MLDQSNPKVSPSFPVSIAVSWEVPARLQEDGRSRASDELHVPAIRYGANPIREMISPGVFIDL